MSDILKKSGSDVPLSEKEQLLVSRLNNEKVEKPLAPPVEAEEGKVSEEESKKLYKASIALAKKVTEEMQKSGEDIAEFSELLLQEMTLIEIGVNQLLLNNENTLALIHAPVKDDYLYSHIVNVGIISAEMGIGIGLKKLKLVELVSTATLCVLEMILFTDIFTHKKARTLPDTRNYINRSLENSKYLHGENRQPVKTYIDVILIAAAYETLVHPPSQKDSLIPYNAVKLMVDNKSLFQEGIIKMFIERFGPFPVGSCVKLSTGEKGCVIRRNVNSPMRPIIRVPCLPESEEYGECKVIDLLESPTIYIKAAIRPEDR